MSTTETFAPAPPPSQQGGFLSRLSEGKAALLVLLCGALLYIPFAGSYGLWDPWETHYGEVAREMTARGDFISLYWAGSPIDTENFWSKPVLAFWLMSIAMHVAGIGGANSPAHEFATSNIVEWTLRMPFILMGLMALYGVFLVTSRFVSRRAGFLAALALGTFPMFTLIARQAMTDMAFVGPMTLALALGALALFDDKDELLPRRNAGRLSWPHHPVFYVVLAAALLLILPQLVIDSVQLSWRFSLFGKRWKLQGIVVMLPYIAGFLAFLYFAARTRYKAPLYLYLAGMLCGLAMLAKGLAGLGLPVIVFVAYLGFTWNWRRLARADLLNAILLAALACALVSFPWHHAMLVRHGKPFWDELYGDNHWRRMVMGRHGDRGSFEYFIRELGYALFPWIAVAPAALSWVVMRPFRGSRDASTPRTERRQEIYWFGAIWFVAAYAVVSLSMTKFHHYILPSLPGLAIVVGCFLDDLLNGRRSRVGLTAALIGLPLLALVTFDLTSAQKSAQHFIWLFSYDYVNSPVGRPWPPELNFISGIAIAAGLAGLATLLLSSARLQRVGTVGLGLVAVGFSWFLLNVYMKQVTDRWSQKPLIARYYQMRTSPDERLIAWQMYWRGETFYTKNEIFQGPSQDRTVFLGDRNAEDLKEYLLRNRGKRVFFVVERTRWATLKSLIPEDARETLRVVDERNNKFYLALAQL